VPLLVSIQAATVSSIDLPFKSTSATIPAASAFEILKFSITLAASGHFSYNPLQAAFQIGPVGLPQS